MHQEKIESVSDNNMVPRCEEFVGPRWDLIQSSANTDDTDEEKTAINASKDQASEDLEDKIKKFSADITARAMENPLIRQAMKRFLR